jgi:hypothetical protein
MAAREPEPVTDPLCDGDPLARALAKLRPAQTCLDAQRLLFLAGQAERARTVAFWRWVSVGQLAALVAVGGAYLLTSLNDSAPMSRGEAGSYTAPRPRLPASTPDGGAEEIPPPRPVASEPYYGIPQGFARAEPDDLSPEDRVRWLALRNDVLTAGLGLLPTPGRPELDPRYMKDATFLAIPRPPEPPEPPRNPPED